LRASRDKKRCARQDYHAQFVLVTTSDDTPFALQKAKHIRVVPLLTPTLPPARHTNTYIVGERRLVIIEPATPYPDERARFDTYLDELLTAGCTVEAILLTHHHVDHVGDVTRLADKLGVPVVAHRRTAQKLAGTIAVAHELGDASVIVPFGDTPLTTIFTPGHAPGHICYHDAAHDVIVVGDMIASVGTILIAPADDGDMTEYLASLQTLIDTGAHTLLPAHGAPITDGPDRLRFYIAHRLQREALVRAALTTTPQTLSALTSIVYVELPRALHPVASQSVLAHLLKLERDGVARRVDDEWVRSSNPK
jgi:ribonuclease/clavin/mitogillin